VDENGQMQNPALPDCGQAISAVKAIAIAQQQGQKIYTITQENRATALAKLPVGGTVGQEIRNAVNAGKEVTVHEKAINAFGWSGYGYVIVDPETGAGAYLIEGSGNGSFWIEAGFAAVLGAISLAGLSLGASLFFMLAITIVSIWMTLMLFFIAYDTCGNDYADNFALALTITFALIGSVFFASSKEIIGFAIASAVIPALYAAGATTALSGGCRNIRK
jgi:hypothetical protein